ncbi:hypothetical protein [Iningainema tapete]|uniref:Uncharacterized protein n=1 Tax=Iningainema tapete BLCC-T55 TaxID=2748662 RepID=A0A8J6XKN6_9CYAN|nr:hypothetical protein [Iningainema tapete]MBD2773329.1 hypothetical protein [Iningainema tapete BLCC-T55]
MSQLIEEMSEMWGQQFQELNHLERLWMIQQIANNLCESSDGDDVVCYQVEDALLRINELNTRDKLNLIQALINQVINPS